MLQMTIWYRSITVSFYINYISLQAFDPALFLRIQCLTDCTAKLSKQQIWILIHTIRLFSAMVQLAFFFLFLCHLPTARLFRIVDAWEFFTSALAMVYHWSLNDNNSPRVSRTFLSILVDLNNVAVWIVSSRPVISMSFSTNPLVIVPRAPIPIGIIVTFTFHCFFTSITMSLSYFSLSFNFTQWSAETAKSTILQNLFFFFFLLIIIRSGCLAEIRWSVCM